MVFCMRLWHHDGTKTLSVGFGVAESGPIAQHYGDALRHVATSSGAGNALFKKCGAENPQSLRFCNECAAPFGWEFDKCGFENAPVAKFCGDCAAPLSVAEGSGRSPASAV
jgi:hypothetical protein